MAEKVITSLQDCMVNINDADIQLISNLPDRPSERGIDASTLKSLFDYLPLTVLGLSRINGMITLLVGNGASEIGATNDFERVTVQDFLNELKENKVGGVSYNGNVIKYIRLNGDNVLETSGDGVNFTATGSSGHIILGGNGVELPQRSRMQFMNATVTDDGTQTIIRGIVGEKGEKGDKGDTGTQGIQGEKGERGERGQMAVPYVNQNTGVLSWTITDSVPESILSVNIKGPQGVQGVQGMQGAVGPAGPQGVQGVRGEQGIQGEQGAQGAIGAQGPQGIQGIRGEQGIQGEQGVQGIKGEKGDTGATGPMGPQGERGQNGVDGRSFVLQDIFPTLGALKSAFPTGNEYAYQVTGENREIFIWSERGNDWESLGALQGPMGPQGIQGVRGEKGEKGDTGAQGLQGIQGVQGLQGERGEKGEKGDTGAQGEQGIQGVQGLQGEQGIQGLTGPQGVQGVAGLSAYNIAVLGGYLGSESQFTESLINIGNKVNVADFNALKGVGYTTETVRDNAVSIQALKGVGYVNETVKGNAESIALLDSAKADKTSVYTKVEVESLITASIGNVLNGEV